MSWRLMMALLQVHHDLDCHVLGHVLDKAHHHTSVDLCDNGP